MKTVLSVKDFAILLQLVNKKLYDIKSAKENVYRYIEQVGKYNPYVKSKEEIDEEMEHNLYYQDLLKIKENLGELTIEIETPNIEIKDEKER